MSHFYADIQGNRGQATRQGTKNSGIAGHVRGWYTGARVVIDYDEQTGKDIVQVYRTNGSTGGGWGSRLIAKWSTDFYRPIERTCENIVQGEECNDCTNRFKCFTQKGKDDENS